MHTRCPISVPKNSIGDQIFLNNHNFILESMITKTIYGFKTMHARVV